MEKILASVIILSEKVLEILNSLIRKHNCPQSLIRRVNIILMASKGISNVEISNQLKINRNTVKHWRNKWANAAITIDTSEVNGMKDKEFYNLIIDILSDDQRPGTPPKFTPEQIVQIVVIACENPKDSGREVSHFTPREIADEAIKRNIVESISPRQVGRFLKMSQI